MKRRCFAPKFAGTLLVLSACSGAEFGDAPGPNPGGGAGQAPQTPRNSSDQGSFEEGPGGLPVTPQGGSAGAGGNDSGEEQVAGGAGAVSAAGASGHELGGADNGGSGGAPACLQPIAEDWTDELTETGPWVSQFGDPIVDIPNERLVLSWDDVASRHDAYTGGYYATAQVTLNGYTPLALYPYAKDGVWPSLRLIGNGTALELGATIYGMDERWRDADWPGFSGVVITGTRTASVTFYLKATEKAIAAKVSHGTRTWRSGWMKGPFKWVDTNLGIFRYVGQNNSDVALVEDDTIWVGRVSGCQGLSDDEIQAEFDN